MLRLQRSFSALPNDEKEKFVMQDQRILRSMRLSFLWALIKTQLQTPWVVGMGLIGTVGLAAQAVSYCFKHLVSLAH